MGNNLKKMEKEIIWMSELMHKNRRGFIVKKITFNPSKELIKQIQREQEASKSKEYFCFLK